MRFALAHAEDWTCEQCGLEQRSGEAERRRWSRNCRNRHKFKHELLQGAKEWRSVTAKLRHVLKIDDIKFFACPLSVITRRTWKILQLVNDVCGAENCEILHLPFPGGYYDQPQWFLDAVRIVRAERARHRKVEMDKMRSSNGG